MNGCPGGLPDVESSGKCSAGSLRALPFYTSSRWSIGDGPSLLPPSTTDAGTPSGPPSKRSPSPLHVRPSFLINGLGAAAPGSAGGPAGASEASEELIVHRGPRFTASQLLERRAGVGDVVLGVAPVRRIVQERLQVADRLVTLSRP